ncbi:MAG: glycoside hydrolase family 95 protein [Anaerolineae bacterium]|nr:glycoside hydrolase family 95 protein [Anaerolineae bacterium]
MPTHNRLWYQKAAEHWTDALPLGTGRLGAMVFGGVATERISLNDDTLWSGEPGQNDYYANIDHTDVYQAVVKLLKEKEYRAAHDLISENWMGRVVNCYQPLGDLLIRWEHGSQAENYCRDLTLETGVSCVEYTINSVTYRREYLASAPDHVLGLHFSASSPGRITMSVELVSPHVHHHSNLCGYYCLHGIAPGQAIRYPFDQLESYKGNRHAKYPEVFTEDGSVREDARQVKYGGEIDGKGMRFAVALTYRVVSGHSNVVDGKLLIEGADAVELYLATGTSYNGFDRSPSRDGRDEVCEVLENLKGLDGKTWDNFQKTAVEEHSRLFGRVSFSLDSMNKKEFLPTDERIRCFDGTDDLGLIPLLFQYGRYLMISGSRPGSQPLNLQGIWNDMILPPWASNYTLNINTEMNYWPAETCNLSECAEPLFRLIQELAVKGKKVAELSFGLTGWTANHNSDLWRVANAVEGNPVHSFWPLAGGWLCQHLWEHYQFSCDRTFLETTAYPLMEGAAQFLNGWLIQNEDGDFLTPVGTSPENHFRVPDGNGGWMSAAMSSGPTMDMAIIRELFTNVLAAADELGIQTAFLDEISDKLPRLLPYQIGKYGQLMEWAQDFEEAEPHHRHTSHLYGVFPGNQITPETAALAEAVKVTLRRRGDESTGWAKGWRICLWARLLDGNHAHAMITSLLTLVESQGDQPKYGSGGGVYANLFDAHPPFQIDGNFGATAGIAEMLLQSQNGEIHLLPALPDMWESGSINGLCARGGYQVDITWREHRLHSCTIRATSGSGCIIRYGEARIHSEFDPGGSATLSLRDFSG